MSAADRGKRAEKAVSTYLAKWAESSAKHDWHRVYDARSAGGRFAAQAGDFAFYTTKAHGLIEVKEVDHEFRLPKKNFDNDQIAKLRKRELAGGNICVLVHFTKVNRWVLPPLNFFYTNLSVPSWDLTNYLGFETAKEALDYYFKGMDINAN